MHAGAFETCADGHLASGFHNAGGSAQALGVELRVAHTVSVGLEIVKAATCFLRARDLAADGVKQSLEFSGVEFFLPTFCPLRRAWMSEAVESFSEITQVLFGMIAVNNLGGIGKLILGEIPNPKGPSPSTTLHGAWQKRRRVASRQTRSAKGARAAAVSSAEALSKAAE